MDMVNIKDFGAAGDGIQNDYASIQSALESGARQVVIPAGKYRVSGTLKVQCNTEIIADDNAEIFVCEKLPKKRGDFLLTNADHVNGNQNITIRGGVWSGNYDGKNNAKVPDIFDQTACSSCIVNFFNVKNLTLENITFANPVTYFTRFSKVDGFVIRNIDFRAETVAINHDGLHFAGECRNGVIENIRAITDGETGDDLLAFNADDCITRLENFDTLRGDIENITVHNVFAENCHTAIRMSSVWATIRNITIENIITGCRTYAVNMDATRYCRTPLFRDEDYPAGVGHIENIVIRNMEAWFTVEGRRQELICAETLCDGFRFENFKRNTVKDKNPGAPTISVSNVSDTEVVYTINGNDIHMTLSGKDEELVLHDSPLSFAIYKKIQ